MRLNLRDLRSLVGRCGGRYALAKITAGLTTLADWRFDRRYATETSHPAELAELKIASQNKAQGVRYEPTQSRPFRLLMQTLKLGRDSTFIDFGCGKGRALLLAAEFGFNRVVGVEFAQELCEVAQHNIDLYRQRSHTRSEIAILHMDATQYEIGDRENVFYMYNPFEDEVMRRVIENIHQSTLKSNRQVFVIYLNPLCRKVVEAHGAFRVHTERLFHRSRFVVYSN